MMSVLPDYKLAKHTILHMAHRYFLIISLCGLLAACSADVSEQNNAPYNQSFPSQTGGTFIDAMPSDPSSLIFMVAGESASSAITANIFNTLLRYNKDLDLAGELAESWQVAADQKTITFHLKPGLVWADGRPLTSEDVYFTWQLIIDEKTRSPYASDFQLVTKAETPDKLTFVVHYDQAFSPALDSWAGLQILPKHKLAGQDIHTTSFAQKPLGSHYYQLKEWRHGEYLKLERNPKAVLGQAQISTLIERIIPDPGAQFLE